MLQREYSQQFNGFPPPPPGISYADVRDDQSIGDLQRSIVSLSQAIRRLTVQPSALQDLAETAPFGAETYGLPHGGRSGAPPVRLDNAGVVDKFAPRKITVSPQSWASSGMGGGGLLAGGGVMAQDA